jgi:four helix bundle protein
MKKIDITDRTFDFAVKIVKLANKLPKSPAGFRIGNQIVGSGTSIGANTQEAQSASSKNDFIHKMNIALREARETKYWLRIILAVELIPKNLIRSHLDKCEELIKILVTIIKKTKSNSKL